MPFEKNFDAWNTQKKIIHQRQPPPYIKDGDIWWCSIGLNVGHEEDGKNEWFERPVCLIRCFRGGLVWVVPFTSHPHSGPYVVRVRFNQRDSWALITHVRLLSTRRLQRKVSHVSEETLVHIRTKLSCLIKAAPPLDCDEASEPFGKL